jgi:hypothetical protein
MKNDLKQVNYNQIWDYITHGQPVKHAFETRYKITNYEN